MVICICVLELLSINNGHFIPQYIHDFDKQNQCCAVRPGCALSMHRMCQCGLIATQDILHFSTFEASLFQGVTGYEMGHSIRAIRLEEYAWGL